MMKPGYRLLRDGIAALPDSYRGEIGAARKGAKTGELSRVIGTSDRYLSGACFEFSGGRLGRGFPIEYRRDGKHETLSW